MSITLKTITAQASASNQAGWWKPFDTDAFGNKYYAACVIPTNGASSTYHNILVAKEATNGEVTTSYCCEGGGKLSTWLNDIGHTNPSIAIDANGFIHVFSSMHTNEIRYYRSQAPYDISTLQRHFFDWPDTAWQYTYPVLSKDSQGNVYLLVRCGVQNQTILTHRMGALFKWTPSANKDVVETLAPLPRNAGKWSRYKLLFWEADRSFYPDDLRIDDEGVLHLAYEVGPQHAGTLRHRGTYARVRSDTLIDVGGKTLTTPLSTRATQGNEVYQDLVEGETFIANGTTGIDSTAGIQTAKIIWDAQAGASLGMVYRYRPMKTSGSSTFGGFGLRIARFSEDAWTHEDLFTLDDGTLSTSAALDATVHNGSVRIYFSLEKGGVAWLCMAQGDTGAWTYYNLTSTQKYPKPLRFQLCKSGSTDIGYLTSPNSGLVMGIAVNEDNTDLSTFSDFAALKASL